jgi:hypothetical protein
MFTRTLLPAIVCWCAATATASADVITDWNDKAVAFVTARTMPPWQGERTAPCDPDDLTGSRRRRGRRDRPDGSPSGG